MSLRELAACRECETRGYVYRFSCVRCVARMVARTPQKFASEWLESWNRNSTPAEFDTMRQAIIAEQDIDQRAGER